MIQEEIKKIIEKAIGGQAPQFSVEIPTEATHGDYTTNVALVLAKKTGKNPRDMANEIITKIGKPANFEKIEVAGPGFINFYLAKDYVIKELKGIGKNFGKNKNLKNQKVIIEYTDPNPFKEFHIGHLMSNTIGESISRIFEFQGAKVKRANYQGDVGIHVAKAIWGKAQNPSISWQDAYVLGSGAYEENEQAKQQIVALNKEIYDRSDMAINKMYDEGKEISLDYFEEIYKKLGTKFDYYFFESGVADFGKKIVESNLGKVFEKGERGAIVYKGEKFGLHTRVFINSEGLPTYEAKELGLAKVKYDKYKYHASIIITGNEVDAYFEVLLLALKEIFPDLAQKTHHIGHGMMRLSEGKMSSRTGNIVTFEYLLREVKKAVLQKMEGRGLENKEGIAEQIAVSALKYSILKQSIGSDIIFDFEKSISFEGDSGPYLQYSYARAQSVLRKAKEEKVKAAFKKNPEQVGRLEKMMRYFPEVVEKAGKEYEPHVITLYLTELAREFNNYYAHHKIVDSKDSMSSYSVALTKAFSLVMKNGLWLLGIQVPEKM